MARPATLLLSCEHGGARVPAELRAAFRGAARALGSHRGQDLGALELARRLARVTGAALVATTVSRLVVDANRSLGHRGLFSEWTRRLQPAEREALVARHWRPHRERVERAVRERSARGGRVVHVGVHSFTPRWRGRARRADVALLYDPARALERALADRWLRELGALRPELRLRRNYPYRGVADGLTTSLRRRLAPGRYLGLELEVAQSFPAGPPRAWRTLQADLARSLLAALG